MGIGLVRNSVNRPQHILRYCIALKYLPKGPNFSLNGLH